MKKLLFLSALLLTPTVGWVQDATSTEKSANTEKKAVATDTKQAAETKQVAAEVVSADKTAKTITIKTSGYDTATSMVSAKTLVAKVDEKAVSLLDLVKPGEKVTLTCTASKDRDCDTVTGIKKASPTSPTDKE